MVFFLDVTVESLVCFVTHMADVTVDLTRSASLVPRLDLM
jgi:hypothetical protein